jgi:hypothetical protein
MIPPCRNGVRWQVGADDGIGGSGRGGESMLFGGNSIYIIRYRKIRLSRVFFKSGVLFFKMEVVLPLAESLGGMLYGCKTVG